MKENYLRKDKYNKDVTIFYKEIDIRIEKITNVKNIIRKHNPKILLGVDGGINVNNIRNVVDAGANFIVMGSALFGTDDYVKCINMLRAQLD